MFAFKTDESMAECPFCTDLQKARDLLPPGQTTCPICGGVIATARPSEASPASYQASAPHRPRRQSDQLQGLIEGRRPLPGENKTPTPSPLSVLTRVRRLDLGTAAALCLGGVALLLDSWPDLSFLTKPLSGVGLVLGIVASVVAAFKKQENRPLAIAVSALCLCVLLFVGSWPTLGGSPPASLWAIALRKEGLLAPQRITEDDWVDASVSAMKRESLQVEVASLRIGAVQLKSQGRQVLSGDKYLVIGLRITDEGIVFRQVPYERWADLAESPSKNPPTLVDNLGRPYAQKSFDPPAKVLGRADLSILIPGRPVGEVLIFSVPPAGVEYLRLSLPAAAFGGMGEFRFQIPRNMLETR